MGLITWNFYWSIKKFSTNKLNLYADRDVKSWVLFFIYIINCRCFVKRWRIANRAKYMRCLSKYPAFVMQPCANMSSDAFAIVQRYFHVKEIIFFVVKKHLIFIHIHKHSYFYLDSGYHHFNEVCADSLVRIKLDNFFVALTCYFFDKRAARRENTITKTVKSVS